MLLKGIFSLLIAASSIVASPSNAVFQRAECTDPDSEMCGGNPLAVASRELPHEPARRMTNAERLARGLPLKSPQMRATRTTRSVPSAGAPVTHTGVLKVKNADNGNEIGFVAKNLVNGGAQFGYDPSLANALVVSFKLPAGAASGRVEMTAVNSDPSWPLLGLVQGRDDGSNDDGGWYLYTAGTKSTPAGSPPLLNSNSYFIGPQRKAESVVWNAAVNAGVITFTQTWIQLDHTEFPLQLWTQSTGLYAGGNMDAFHTRFPAPVTAITYQFVPT
ncbi:hypothetical protein DL96DRAFT_1562858 [Flagelloscypha sp. PMI_526]|nr:hypothetical protein DL96DRAFT_1562858 [Flagelloscypha sp. PMI_526]